MRHIKFSSHHRTAIQCSFEILKALGILYTTTQSKVTESNSTNKKRNPYPMKLNQDYWKINHEQIFAPALIHT
jgi:hypothetical protein